MVEDTLHISITRASHIHDTELVKTSIYMYVFSPHKFVTKKLNMNLLKNCCECICYAISVNRAISVLGGSP